MTKRYLNNDSLNVEADEAIKKINENIEETRLANQRLHDDFVTMKQTAQHYSAQMELEKQLRALAQRRLEELTKENEELRFQIQVLVQNAGQHAACRGCGADIYWFELKSGKRAPFNEDGASHFSTCPQADFFRRKGEDK